MSTTGTKKRGSSGRAKGGGPGTARPKLGGRAPKRAAEFLERLLPESDEQSGEAFADRQTRRKTAHKMERTFDRALETFDRIEQELEKDEASIEQREWDDRDERRRSDERAREREEDRKDVRLGLEILEQNQTRAHRNVFLVLAVLTTLAAIVLACIAVSQEEAGFAGISLLNGALSGVFFRLVRRPSKKSTATTEAAVGAPPWRWSVLELQEEVDEESRGDGS